LSGGIEDQRRQTWFLPSYILITSYANKKEVEKTGKKFRGLEPNFVGITKKKQGQTGKT
jgi:hypothetical protein